jgi:hypothetical protein
MINLQVIHESVASYLGGGGSSFDASFLRAARRVTADINRQCFLELPLPSSTSAMIDLDEGMYYQAYDDGVMYYMQLSGEWVRERDIPNAAQRYQRSLAMSQYHAVQELDPPAGYPERT